LTIIGRYAKVAFAFQKLSAIIATIVPNTWNVMAIVFLRTVHRQDVSPLMNVLMMFVFLYLAVRLNEIVKIMRNALWEHAFPHALRMIAIKESKNVLISGPTMGFA
jgi:hypothetical protein